MVTSEGAVSSEFFADLFAQVPIMMILRGLGPRASVDLARRGWSSGIRAVEIPIQSADDLLVFRAVRDAAGGDPPAVAAAGPTPVVGAGTIVTVAQVAQLYGEGAAYMVSPGYDPSVATACRRLDLPFLPGVATATEVQRIAGAGYRWAKAFPASALGQDWFRAMRGPFPQLSFVATGGVSPANAAGYLSAGAHAVSLGSSVGLDSDLAALAREISVH